MQDAQRTNQSEPKKPLYSTDFLSTSEYSFPHFFYGIYARGVIRAKRHFEPGRHLEEWCYRIQKYPKTLTVAPRKHIKTTLNLGYIAWQLYKLTRNPQMLFDEILYMSYLEDNAGYQLRWLKRYLSFIPYFESLKSLTIANSILHYAYKGREFICAPCGILAFKRGQHPRILICDDILKDPKSKAMGAGVLEDIKRIFAEEVESMPTDELHVFGTPQANGDLFTVLEGNPNYNCKRYPAEMDVVNKKALWPEVFPWEKLQQIRKDLGDKAYNKEYLCMPVRGEEGFFSSKRLNIICRPRLKNYDLLKPVKLREFCYGGLDIGKKTHPSHLCVLGIDRKGRKIQVHSKWMDGWDYKDQIEYCRQAMAVFNMQKLLYDDTRAEFEGFKEVGDLPGGMEGVPMTGKAIWEMASDLDVEVTKGGIMLLNEQRQKNQLLNVDNDLKAPETEEGHSDCFWSLVLALRAHKLGSSPLVWEV